MHFKNNKNNVFSFHIQICFELSVNVYVIRSKDSTLDLSN